MESDFQILLATPEDIPEIAAVRKEGWLLTYPNTELNITEADILTEDFDSEERIQGWKKVFSNSNFHHLVAKENGKVIGFILGKKGEGQNEIRGLYVLNSHQKKGIGRLLLDKLVEWFGSEKDISLKVATYNNNAIKFYERYGFVLGDKVIATPDDLLENGKEIPEIYMILKVK